mmetsp:Transcript_9181/g.25410  ORF Transcript_9181/g.25410 Transcript_9181/m.25410 type:complete len:201 (+) Transcript_9181:705-1307(+)
MSCFALVAFAPPNKQDDCKKDESTRKSCDHHKARFTCLSRRALRNICFRIFDIRQCLGLAEFHADQAKTHFQHERRVRKDLLYFGPRKRDGLARCGIIHEVQANLSAIVLAGIARVVGTARIIVWYVRGGSGFTNNIRPVPILDVAFEHKPCQPAFQEGFQLFYNRRNIGIREILHRVLPLQRLHDQALQLTHVTKIGGV